MISNSLKVAQKTEEKEKGNFNTNHLIRPSMYSNILHFNFF